MSNENTDYKAMYLETRRELDEILGVCRQREQLIWTYRDGVGMGYSRDANGVLYKYSEEQPDPNRPRCYTRKTFWCDGKVRTFEYLNADRRIHRDDGPAQISYVAGLLSEECYFQDGRMTESKIYNMKGELIEWWRHTKEGTDLVNHCTYYDGDGNVTHKEMKINGKRNYIIECNDDFEHEKRYKTSTNGKHYMYRETWRDSYHLMYDRDGDLPAVIEYNEDGDVVLEELWKKGILMGPDGKVLDDSYERFSKLIPNC